MAEGFLKSFDKSLDVISAGTKPSGNVHPKAIQVMKEMGIDLSKNHPKSVELFLDEEFDYVITVCGGAKETCPMFTGKVQNRLHIGFDDPADAVGTDDFILSVFRNIRNEIKQDFTDFYDNNLKKSNL